MDQVLFLQLPRVWLSTLNQTLGFSIQEPLQLQLAAQLLLTTGLTGPGLSINLKNGVYEGMSEWEFTLKGPNQ